MINKVKLGYHVVRFVKTCVETQYLISNKLVERRNNMLEISIKSDSLEVTNEIGKLIGEEAFVGEVITLSGDLGAGKTTLTKEIGRTIGVKEDINSPTFNILKCYFNKNGLNLYHIDGYRLEGVPKENKNIGLEEVIEGDGLAVIEWPIYINEFLDFEESLNITITINKDTNVRLFKLETYNDTKFNDLFIKLRNKFDK